MDNGPCKKEGKDSDAREFKDTDSNVAVKVTDSNVADR